MKINKFLLFVVVLIFSYLSAGFWGALYSQLLNLPSGFSGFIVSDAVRNIINGIPSSYTFFLLLLFTAFGGEKKYRWILILLIPAMIFEITLDLSHIYFPVAVGLLGWGLGMLVSKFLQSRQRGKT